MQQVADPYRALGVSRGASEAEIKAAHRKLAKRHHPDAGDGDTRRFLRVQEAYRVLSDPLLRREWDARHAGPVRATQPGATQPAATRPGARPAAARPAGAPPTAARPRPARHAPPPQQPTGASAGPPPDPTTGRPSETGPGRPRSTRAYTWSAAEVPWWEETGTRDGRSRPGRRQEPVAPPESGRPETAHDFDVYNRSSGAAWSMAARAYFRRGDEDLPSRGSFNHQGTQPLTAARARAAAESEARRRAAAGPAAPGPAAPSQAAPPPSRSHRPRPDPAYAYASAGVARDARRIFQVRERFLRQVRARAWPSLRERLLYALVAWLPIMALIGYGAAFATGCDRDALGCTPLFESGQALLSAAALGLLAVLPRVAYVGALATVGLLLAAGLSVGAITVWGVGLPLTGAATAALGVVLLLAYAASAAAVLLRNPASRPWSAGLSADRSR